MIRVENRRSYKGEGVYVGRNVRNLQGSVLGNPYKVKPHGPHERGESVEMYRRWLWGHVRGGAGNVYSELMRLKSLAEQGDLTLVCWCVPERCHAEVVKAAIEWLMRRE